MNCCVITRHVRPPSVVPALEFGAQERQVVIPLDERHAAEALVIERLDDAAMPVLSGAKILSECP